MMGVLMGPSGRRDIQRGSGEPPIRAAIEFLRIPSAQPLGFSTALAPERTMMASRLSFEIPATLRSNESPLIPLPYEK